MAPTPTPKPTTKPTATSPSPSATVKDPDFSNLREVVTFIVGPQKAKFIAHKQFACDHSPVLNAAFNGSFVEGQTQTYTMEDTTEEVFALLSQWLYTQRLNGELGGKGKAGLNLPRLWILAEKLLMPRLQNLVIGLIESFRFKHSEICSSMFQYVWDNTCANSPLRRLYVHQCVWNLTKESYHSVLDHFPKQMLADICFQFRENANNQTKFSRNMVDFHVKEEEKSLRPLFEHSRSIPSKMFWAMT